MDELAWALYFLGYSVGEDKFSEDGKSQGDYQEVINPEAAFVEEAVLMALGQLLRWVFLHVGREGWGFRLAYKIN